MIMKVSFYNIYFKHKDKYFVYNTLTTSLIVLDEKTFMSLKNAEIDTISTDIKSQLQKQGFIVDENLNETSVYECYYNEIQYSGFKDELRIVFVPTYSCNLRCIYCFEECSNYNKIRQEDINQIIEFVKNQLRSNCHYKKMSLVLFGGEPLLCTDECIMLCDALLSISHELGVELNTKISTNAVLVTSQVVQNLFAPSNMRIQITMDGCKQYHDKRRIYRNGTGTYDKILQSIKLINEFGLKDNIDLRINVDKNNIDSLEEVFADVYDKVGYIYVGLLRAAGNNKERLSDCISDNDYILKYRPQLEPLFRKYGKQLHYGAFGKKHACALNSGNSFIFDCNLDVYKCDNLIGQPKYSVGKIVDGLLKKSPEYFNQRTWSPFHFEKCRKCNRLPVCTASCAYLCLSKNGSMNNPICFVTEEQLVCKIKQYIDNL